MNLLNWYCYSICLAVFSAHGAWSEVSENDFKHVNSAIHDIHAPLVSKRYNSSTELIQLYGDFGGAFKVDSARKFLGEQRFAITLTGQFAQGAAMSALGYAIVACHEWSHILGEEPKQKSKLDKWSSVEGQADYHATNKCMWRFVETLPTPIIQSFDRDSIAMCERSFGHDLNKFLGCLRIMSGIQAMVDHFNQTESKKNPVSILSKDTTEVSATLQKYPSPQCRVDTWVAGLFDEPRPRCWYKD